MPGPEPSVLVGGLFGYGPAPGVELIPYFLALLGWMGLALVAALLSPITALLRRFRKPRGDPDAEPGSEPTPAPVPESPNAARPDCA